MRCLTAAMALTITAGCWGQATSKSTAKPSADSKYNQYYDTRNEATITGTIIGKLKGAPAEGQAQSASIIVRAKGHSYSVDLGPAAYVASLSGRLNMGDHVTVIGSPIVLNGNENLILARQVRKGNEVLAFRSGGGAPLWATVSPGPPVTGQVVGRNTLNINGDQEEAYQLMTPNGLIDVAVAPNSWLMQNGLGFKFGQFITVYLGAGPTQFGPYIYMANGIATGGAPYLAPPVHGR